MGNEHLLKLARVARRPLTSDHLRNKRVAVDLYSWLHRVVMSDKNYRRYVIYRQSTAIARTLCTYVQQLSQTCLTVTIIADGNNLPGKKQINEKRATSNALQAKFDALAELLTSNEYIFDWKSEEGKQIDALASAISHSIPYALFRDVRDAILNLRLSNVDFRVAPYECDHQAIKLFDQDLIDAIIGTDSDYLVNGARVLITDFGFVKGKFSGYVWDVSVLESEARRIVALLLLSFPPTTGNSKHPQELSLRGHPLPS